MCLTPNQKYGSGPKNRSIILIFPRVKLKMRRHAQWASGVRTKRAILPRRVVWPDGAANRRSTFQRKDVDGVRFLNPDIRAVVHGSCSAWDSTPFAFLFSRPRQSVA
jgi:hypothetical protein